MVATTSLADAPSIDAAPRAASAAASGRAADELPPASSPAGPMACTASRAAPFLIYVFASWTACAPGSDDHPTDAVVAGRRDRAGGGVEDELLVAEEQGGLARVPAYQQVSCGVVDVGRHAGCGGVGRQLALVSPGQGLVAGGAPGDGGGVAGGVVGVGCGALSGLETGRAGRSQ